MVTGGVPWMQNTDSVLTGSETLLLEVGRGPFSGSDLRWGSLGIGRVREGEERKGWVGRGV